MRATACAFAPRRPVGGFLDRDPWPITVVNTRGAVDNPNGKTRNGRTDTAALRRSRPR